MIRSVVPLQCIIPIDDAKNNIYTLTVVFLRANSQLKDEIPRVKDCSCEIVDRYLLRVLLVCNTVKDESKIAGRHRFVKKILDDAGLAKELDQYVIQIVAWTRMESRRRSKIHAELEPGYVPPTRKPKSSSCCKPKSSCSRKPKSSSSQKIPSKPLGDNNGKSKEEEFVVGDDSGNKSSEWNSDEESVFEEEPEVKTESDDEFERMLESDGESDYDDINIDSDDEDDSSYD